MIDIKTDGITYIEPVPGADSDWYFGLSGECGDLYEAEELYRDGRPVEGNSLCLVHYPDGAVYRPVEKTAGVYLEKPVFFGGCIYLLSVDFPREEIRILRFDCSSYGCGTAAVLPLGSVKNCYNLMLHVAPLSLTRQGDDDVFEIIWPEQVSFSMEMHESFFLREGERLYFSKWYEEGEGTDYRYWEETVARDLAGKLIEVLPGDVRLMPNGELWHIS